jgi:hypothetical protein
VKDKNTTKHEIVSLSSKLIGIYSVLHSFNYIQTFGMQLTIANANSSGYDLFFIYSFTVLAFCITFGLGLVLFFFSKRAAIIFVGKEDTNLEPEKEGTNNFQLIAFSVVGVLLVTRGLPHLIRVILMVWYSTRTTLPRIPAGTQLCIDGFVALVEILLGCWLLFGTSGIINAINKLRRG